MPRRVAYKTAAAEATPSFGRQRPGMTNFDDGGCGSKPMHPKEALMIIRIVAALLLFLTCGHAMAQDVPGIEICTVEKTMERRTSCLQSNVNFLQKSINKLAVDNQQKLDAANRQIEALKSTIAGLQKTLDDVQAAQKKKDTPPPAAPASPPTKDAK
jgi:uncharacterized protein YecT (DUF1311 family)